jgi:hypothetical protein
LKKFWFLILAIVVVSYHRESHAEITASSVKKVKLPNDINYWKNNKFAKMVGLLQLPSDKAGSDRIEVWIKIPKGQVVTVRGLPWQDRYSLVYPAGTIADRVELADNRIEDVRGARIDDEGHTLFHVYEPAPKKNQNKIFGLEWLREDDPQKSNIADEVVGRALVKLYYPTPEKVNPKEIESFLRHNRCTNCHMPDVSRAKTSPFLRYESDSRGFFQPLTVLEDRISVRDHRAWDLNADDPFVTVWCGDKKTAALTDGEKRGYKCENSVSPEGTLDTSAALDAGNAHALDLCAARKYLYDHMDEKARSAFSVSFQACGLGTPH